MTDTPRQYRFGPDAIRTPANVITIVRLLFTIPVLMMILDGVDLGSVRRQRRYSREAVGNP